MEASAGTLWHALLAVAPWGNLAWPPPEYPWNPPYGAYLAPHTPAEWDSLPVVDMHATPLVW